MSRGYFSRQPVTWVLKSTSRGYSNRQPVTWVLKSTHSCHVGIEIDNQSRGYWNRQPVTWVLKSTHTCNVGMKVQMSINDTIIVDSSMKKTNIGMHKDDSHLWHFFYFRSANWCFCYASFRHHRPHQVHKASRRTTNCVFVKVWDTMLFL